MRLSVNHSSARGQTSVEYLLLLAVVAVLVITAFSNGGLIDKVRNTAGDYYNTVTRVIMDSDDGSRTLPSGRTVSMDTPNPINGGWCPIVCPTGYGPTTIYGACECPAPAFGGQGCPGLTVSCVGNKETAGPNSGGACKGQIVYCGGTTSCGPCPPGQTCLPPDGHCGCPDNLTCNGQGGSPIGSIPDSACQSCVCVSGSYYDQATNSCLSYCPAPPGAVSSCDSWNGTTCAPVTCGTNQYCDTSKPAACQCQCDQYSHWDGNGCAYCTAQQGHCTHVVVTTPGSADACNTGEVTTCEQMNGPNGGCAQYEWCDTSSNACQWDWGCQGNLPDNATLCLNDPPPPDDKTNYKLVTSCTPAAACQATCNNGRLSNGQCVPDTCSACQTWDAASKSCVSAIACGSNNCGQDSCRKSCGTCSSGQTCSSGASGTGNPGTCQCQSQCSGRECGSDGCGGSCGSCPSSTEPSDHTSCSASGQCYYCTPSCNSCSTFIYGDGCGGTCPACLSPNGCYNGRCCTPNCNDGQCHDSSYTGNCGQTCPSNCAGDCCSGRCVHNPVPIGGSCSNCGDYCDFSGSTCCAGTCKYTQGDSDNCGACGKTCSFGTNCSNGACVACVDSCNTGDGKAYCGTFAGCGGSVLDCGNCTEGLTCDSGTHLCS